MLDINLSYPSENKWYNLEPNSIYSIDNSDEIILVISNAILSYHSNILKKIQPEEQERYKNLTFRKITGTITIHGS